jgi:hypothetical protein
MKNIHWKDFLADKKRTIYFVILAIFVLLSACLFSMFMCWNETRPGFIFDDPILKLIPPVDFSRLTMAFTLIPILVGLFKIFTKPKATVYFCFTAILICIFRTITLYLTPLDPPPDIIPLTDPVIEKLFYGGKVLLKDLFFSGHTANLVVIGLLTEDKIFKRLLYCCAVVVGTLLMIQHAHYSIDVFAAPFFAILAYKLGVYTANKTILKKIKV